MNKNDLKKIAANAAIDHIIPKLDTNSIIGIGTGSTINYFIKELSYHRVKFNGTISSSKATSKVLKEYGIPVYELHNFNKLDFYVDGTDESNSKLELIKGGGGALTNEKILAAVSKTFICIADTEKLVSCLGGFPLPVEIIPISRNYVSRELIKLGGTPIYRQGILTDNNNIILDVHNLKITNPIMLEQKINSITGVVTNGLFAIRPADLLLLGTINGVQFLIR